MVLRLAFTHNPPPSASRIAGITGTRNCALQQVNHAVCKWHLNKAVENGGGLFWDFHRLQMQYVNFGLLGQDPSCDWKPCWESLKREQGPGIRWFSTVWRWYCDMFRNRRKADGWSKWGQIWMLLCLSDNHWASLFCSHYFHSFFKILLIPRGFWYAVTFRLHCPKH
jgi:hypothetical protein